MSLLSRHLNKAAEVGRTHPTTPAMNNDLVTQFSRLVNNAGQPWPYQSEPGSDGFGLTLVLVVNPYLMPLSVVQHRNVVDIRNVSLTIFTLGTNVDNRQLATKIQEVIYIETHAAS